MAVRNFFYDIGFFSSKSYSIPLICVGNLSTGGTGKSPMIELLVRILNPQYKIATLSRGYKRTTSGFLEVEPLHTTSEVGDEPLQFKTNYPNLTVAVEANRQIGISRLLHKHPDLDVVLLDDAFQHRKVKAQLNILLTTYGDLYTHDFVLPTGNLREFPIGAKRAQIIVVTKCPSRLSHGEQSKIQQDLKPKPYQQLFFSTIVYSEFVFSSNKKLKLIDFDGFTLVTGIANPKPLLTHLKSLGKDFEHLKFPDHHEFSNIELDNLEKCSKILTTQKDFMRLKSKLKTEELYYLPIETELLDRPELFSKAVQDYLFES
jgi:tetraacyldisaccharide 4'-kinase